jgi:hypothetical protein
MSMNRKFESLARDLDQDSLEQLRQVVASEIQGRRQKAAIRLEDIHPKMTAADKEQAAREIARVLEQGE